MSDKECTCYEFTDGHQAGCPMNRTGLTTDRIAEIRERASKATAIRDLKFRLYANQGGRAFSKANDDLVLDAYDANNRDFYFSAAADIPYLLAQLDAARAEVERLRAVVDKLPKTADGVPVTIGMDAWIVVREDPEYWGVKSIGEAVCEKVTSICEGSAFREYSGTFTIGSRNWEGGNLDIYSTREAAEAAKEKP